MTDPCKDCPERQTYARMFDMHFWGSDCPYICEERTKYDEWLEAQKEDDALDRFQGDPG